jgi:DNA (cytosine-5)-methyltransferase 1
VADTMQCRQSGPWEPVNAQHTTPAKAGEAAQPGHGSVGEIWQAEPDVGRVAHGVPKRVDRLKGLGNAVVPQIPELIGNAILEAEQCR